MIYLTVFIVLVFLICRYDINGKIVNREFSFNFILVVLVVIAGMRYRLGADTPNYLYQFYHNTPKLWELSSDNFQWDGDPLFRLLNTVVLSLGGRFYMVQFLHAFFVNYLLFRYIKRHSQYIFTCVFLYFIWMYTYYNMEEMRASMSLVVCLYANDYILEKKWIKGYLLFIIAGLFHKSAYILLITPLFFWTKLNFVGYLIILGAYLFGVFVQSQFGDYIELLEFSEAASEKMEGYVRTNRYLEQGGNLNYFIAQIFPFLLYPVIAFIYNKRKNNNLELLKLQPLLLIGLAFVAIQASIELAYRYVHFYAIYLILYMSQLFVDVVKNNKHLHGVAYMKTFVLLVPFLVVVARVQKDLYVRYYPYSSIIEKSVDRDREKDFREQLRPSPNINEY